MLRFFKGGPRAHGRVGVLPGAFNPVTKAHIALAEASANQYHLDQILLLLPEIFPHKEYAGAPFEERLALLQAALSGTPGWAIASSDLGLFVDIAKAVRDDYGPAVDIYLICGRDAAERIVNWDYGGGPGFAQQLEQFQMLVGSREQSYDVPTGLKGRIHAVEMPPGLREVSATEVRLAISQDKAWEHLVPAAVADEIVQRGLYLTCPRAR